MSYKIQFLNDEEFERLPGRDMQKKIGVAYPEYGEAYVRKSGSNTMDVFTALHELEHMQGNSLDEHFDTENRCYYKDFAQSLNPIHMISSLVDMSLHNPLSQAMFGIPNGKPQQPQQPQMPQFGMQGQQAPQGAPMPNVIQTTGSGSGVGGSGASPGAAQPSIYGSYSGRNPMAMFG